MAVREVVEELKQVYSTDIILGKPLEVDHLKIIPLATVGIGYGQRGVSEDRNATRGAGGILSPVGVLVVSPQGVQLLPIAKGVLEQVLGAVTPVVLQQIRHTAPQAATVAERQARLPIPELLATLYAFLPKDGLKFGFSLASVARHRLLRGMVGTGTVHGGVPVWPVSLFGTVSIALLVGQQCAAALRRPPYADVVFVLIGGLVLGIVRVIPVLGWIVWRILSIVGFGAVLRLQLDFDGTKIIPIVSLGFGFGAGSGVKEKAEDAENKEESGTGGGGGGFVTPQGLLVTTKDGDVKVIEARKGIVSEIVKGLAPVILEAIKAKQGAEKKGEPKGPLAKP